MCFVVVVFKLQRKASFVYYFSSADDDAQLDDKNKMSWVENKHKHFPLFIFLSRNIYLFNLFMFYLCGSCCLLRDALAIFESNDLDWNFCLLKFRNLMKHFSYSDVCRGNGMGKSIDRGGWKWSGFWLYFLQRNLFWSSIKAFMNFGILKTAAI